MKGIWNQQIITDSFLLTIQLSQPDNREVREDISGEGLRKGTPKHLSRAILRAYYGYAFLAQHKNIRYKTDGNVPYTVVVWPDVIHSME
jgi:hypothetical protein